MPVTGFAKVLDSDSAPVMAVSLIILPRQIKIVVFEGDLVVSNHYFPSF
jgi:hypothetical protein